MNDTDRHTGIRIGIAAVALLAAVLMPGCQWPQKSSNDILQCRTELQRLRDENASLKQKLAAAERTVAGQTTQIKNLQRFDPELTHKLIVVDQIKLDRLTGGYDTNRDGVDEGVVAYVQPIDADTHAVKAAGDVSICLFDLSSDTPTLIGKIDLNPEQTRRTWHSRLWTDYFAVKCPIIKKPRGDRITVKATFVELLTGKEFTAQTNCRIAIKPAKNN